MVESVDTSKITTPPISSMVSCDDHHINNGTITPPPKVPTPPPKVSTPPPHQDEHTSFIEILKKLARVGSIHKDLHLHSHSNINSPISSTTSSRNTSRSASRNTSANNSSEEDTDDEDYPPRSPALQRRGERDNNNTPEIEDDLASDKKHPLYLASTMKKLGGMLGTWSDRYCVLLPEEMVIIYYKKKRHYVERRKPHGVISIQGAAAKRKNDEEDREHVFVIFYPYQNHREIVHLQCASDQQACSWIKAINQLKSESQK